jgi:hypothetical protein
MDAGWNWSQNERVNERGFEVDIDRMTYRWPTGGAYRRRA